MKITRITEQAKRPNRYSIFVDGKYSFSLSETALLEYRLAPGQELDKTELEKLKQLSSQDKTYGLALRYAAMRPRSLWEMENYLKRKQVGPTQAEVIISKLKALNMLNDQAFASAWIDNRRLLKSVSRRRLAQELRQKRVSQEIIDTTLMADETSELETLRELAAKKRQQAKYKDDLKLMQYLARQGFKYDDVKQVIQELN